MIVKNESKVLRRCLDSVADLMDEIIIVDTGSTDDTKAIASEYTSSIYDFEWIDDFSAARNYSFSLANMDYIYAADADEVLDETNRERFRLLKEALLPEIDMVQMYYCNQLEFGTAYNYDKEYRPKLYKRLRTFTWYEPVHEMVRLEPLIYDSDIEIMHMPLSNHSGRDFKSFLRQYNSGHRLSARLHHMYAMELYISGNDEDFINSIPVFKDTLDDTSRSIDEIKDALAVLTKAYRVNNNERAFFTTALKSVSDTPCAEVCCELGEFYYSINDYNEACLWFLNALEETDSILNIKTSGIIPAGRIADCYEAVGDNETAKLYREKAI